MVIQAKAAPDQGLRAPVGAGPVSWIDSRVRDAERARRSPRPAAAPSGDSTGHMHGHGGGMKEDADLPGAEIRVARSTDGGKTFGPSLAVDGDVCPCCRTSLAVGPDGSVYVAWRKVFPGDVRDVVVSRLAPGAANWSAPARVHQCGALRTVLVSRRFRPAAAQPVPRSRVAARGQPLRGGYA